MVAFIALPIEVNREVIGVLACHRIRSRDRQLNDDVAVLRILATLAGQLLQLQALVLEKTRALQAKNQLLTQALQAATAPLRHHRHVPRAVAGLERTGARG